MKNIFKGLHFKFKHKGFTLLEIIIVVGITTVLAGIGVSTYTNQQRAKLLDTAAQEIVGYLRYAQQKSMAQEGTNQWGIHFENPASGDDFYSLYTGSSYASSEEVRYLPNNINFITPSVGESINIPFYKLVGDSSGGAITILGYSNERITITVQSQGLIVYSEAGLTSGYAWSSHIGWIDFGKSGGNVFTPGGIGDMSGLVWSNIAGWISLNCVSTNSCETVEYKVSSDASGNLSGWAWSEKFGWISFNCSNDSSCATSNYKVTVDQSTGYFDGYAWSQNLGWVSFNCVTGGVGQTDICSTSDYKVLTI